jgi:two-component system NtrC family response regulator
LAYSWPGNDRELKNAIERVAILCRGETAARGQPAAPPDWTKGDLATALGLLVAFMLTQALLEADSNRTGAAKRLSIHGQSLYSKMQKYGIDLAEVSGDRSADVVNPDKRREPDNSQ